MKADVKSSARAEASQAIGRGAAQRLKALKAIIEH